MRANHQFGGNVDWTKTAKKGDPKVTRFGTPTKAVLWATIKGHCAECIGSSHEVPHCTSPKCRLFPFRLGPGRMDEAALMPTQAAPYVREDEIGAGHEAAPAE
jgi:hypothetical protein